MVIILFSFFVHSIYPLRVRNYFEMNNIMTAGETSIPTEIQSDLSVVTNSNQKTVKSCR